LVLPLLLLLLLVMLMLTSTLLAIPRGKCNNNAELEYVHYFT
jgi:hypothetical protein